MENSLQSKIIVIFKVKVIMIITIFKTNFCVFTNIYAKTRAGYRRNVYKKDKVLAFNKPNAEIDAGK